MDTSIFKINKLSPKSLFSDSKQSWFFGDYITLEEDEMIFSECHLKFLPLHLISKWSRCGLTAEYLSKYIALNSEKIIEVENFASTVINELIENAVKFSFDKSESILVSMHQTEKAVLVRIENVADYDSVKKFVDFLEEIDLTDIEETMIKRIEKSATSDGDVSGLGILSIINDSDVTFGMKICSESAEDETFSVDIKILFKI
ncbi:hypothetical protein HOG98_02620 [bacterium]|jgi:hypothetical protein|nr:hypothetical protein [bacterium]